MSRTIFIGRNKDGTVVLAYGVDQTDLRKSGPGGRTVATTVIRLVQVGRSSMTPNERFINGNQFQALVARPVTLLTDEQTKREIRERLLKSGNASAVAQFDAGTCREGDVLACFPDILVKGDPDSEEGMERDDDGNLIEPLRKSDDDAPALVRRADGSAAEDGVVDLRAAAAELDALVTPP
jgi:hypothetical protein